MMEQKDIKERLKECFDILSDKYEIDIQEVIDFKDLIEVIK